MEQLQKPEERLCKSSRNTKKDYFQKLNIKDLADNQKFWKTIKSFFSNKGLNSNKLMLREKDVVADERALVTLMNNYFVNITVDLDLKRDSEKFYDTPACLYNTKKKFQDHQSILKIKKAFNLTDLFSFHEITEDEIRKDPKSHPSWRYSCENVKIYN